jgi:glucose/mannose transport system permease protein
MGNLAVYSLCFISGCVLLGYVLAILIDRSVRYEALYRTIFMLPLSISFVVTGIIWQWLLNPTLGIQQAVRDLGWDDFAFNWLVRSDRSIYTIAIAAIWQQAGMCMVLFLAGLRSIDPKVWQIARIDAIPPWRVYVQVITPMLGPAFVAAIVLLFSMAAKSFDLVITLTGGGPGFASDLPARFVVELIGRQELGLAAAGACVLLCTVAAVIGPYIYIMTRRQTALR